MASSPVPVPQSPDKLWVQVVLPHVEEELRRISASFPKSTLPPNFEDTFLRIAEKDYWEAIGKKTNFKKWADEIKDWKRWAHGRIPYEEINPTYLASQWDKLCEKNPEGKGFRGQAPETVKKLVKSLKPYEMTDEDFFNSVLNETCINFMRRYFSSFQKPMDVWLYELAATSARDFVKTWVPGIRYPDKRDRPKGFDSIDEPPKSDPEGQPLSAKLSAEESPGIKRRKAFVGEIREKHRGEGPGAKLSDTVIELFYTWGYTKREIVRIAKERKLSVQDVTEILDHDCLRLGVIGRQELSK